jgi:hypothetical protein
LPTPGYELILKVGDQFWWHDPVPSPAEWRWFRVDRVYPPKLTSDHPLGIFPAYGMSEMYVVREGPKDSEPSMFWLRALYTDLQIVALEELRTTPPPTPAK